MYQPLHGDKRQRQLAFLSSASLSRQSVVEPTAYEMHILRARRQPHVQSSSGFPGQYHAQQRFNDLALAAATEALDDGLALESELAQTIEVRFDDVYGQSAPKIADTPVTYRYAVAHVRFVRANLWSRWLVRYYVVAVLLCALSYLGAWINPAATPARVALGIITILTVISNYNSCAQAGAANDPA
jgi:hypothetical protein